MLRGRRGKGEGGGCIWRQESCRCQSEQRSERARGFSVGMRLASCWLASRVFAFFQLYLPSCYVLPVLPLPAG